ncbi:MAG: NHL repeat-containing protein [Ignavibacteriaceae bacterium]
MKNIVFNFLFIFFFIPSFINAQLFEYQTSIGNFKKANSFYISASGIIYVTDSGSNQITSIDTLGNILESTGGYGWAEETFDEPVDVFATPLNIYVSDKNNHRIQRFDRNLNYISSISNRDYENDEVKFGYPQGCVVSNQGDVYILDSENQRVVKFDLFGNFVQNFGGFDAGNYQLKRPISMAVSASNLLYVADDSGIIIFDSFGNGIGRIGLEVKPVSVRIIFDEMTITSNNLIYNHNLRSESLNITEIQFSEFEIKKVISSFLYNNKLYILFPDKISIFSAAN